MTNVESALDARGESIRHTLDSRTRELNSMLASRSAELSRLIEEKAKPIVNEYAVVGQDAAEKIVTAAQQSANLLSETNSGMVGMVEQAIDDYARASSDAANKLVSATRQSTDMLSHSHSSMTDVVNGATDSLNVAVARATQEFKQADVALNSATTSFSESASRASDLITTSSRLLESKVDRLANVSGTTLSQVAGIVARFDEHTSVLSQAGELLTSAQANLVGTLEERQEALRSLSVGLLQRSEEIENSMRGVMSVVEQTWAKPSSAPPKWRATCAKTSTPPSTILVARWTRPNSGRAVRRRTCVARFWQPARKRHVRSKAPCPRRRSIRTSLRSSAQRRRLVAVRRRQD